MRDEEARVESVGAAGGVGRGEHVVTDELAARGRAAARGLDVGGRRIEANAALAHQHAREQLGRVPGAAAEVDRERAAAPARRGEKLLRRRLEHARHQREPLRRAVGISERIAHARAAAWASITSRGACTSSISTPSPPSGNSPPPLGWMKQTS